MLSASVCLLLIKCQSTIRYVAIFITLKIEAVSSISDMNVETPFNWLSPDPTRAKIQSVMGISAKLHGTKQPS